MSSTNRGAERAPNDAYFTPDPVARACVETLGLDDGIVIWEPSAGGGAFCRAAADAAQGLVFASDIAEQAPTYDTLVEWGVRDWRAGHDMIKGWPTDFGGKPDWVIGNPPFNEAEAHVRVALNTCRVGAAFLLRLAFLEGAKRRDFWRNYPAAEVHVLTARPSFTGGATDSCAYGWFVWRRPFAGPTVLRHLDWKPRL